MAAEPSGLIAITIYDLKRVTLAGGYLDLSYPDIQNHHRVLPHKPNLDPECTSTHENGIRWCNSVFSWTFGALRFIKHKFLFLNCFKTKKRLSKSRLVKYWWNVYIPNWWSTGDGRVKPACFSNVIGCYYHLFYVRSQFSAVSKQAFKTLKGKQNTGCGPTCPHLARI